MVLIGDMMLALVGDMFARRCLFGQETVAGVRFSKKIFNRIRTLYSYICAMSSYTF